MSRQRQMAQPVRPRCLVFDHPTRGYFVLKNIVNTQPDYCYANANDNKAIQCGLKRSTRPRVPLVKRLPMRPFGLNQLELVTPPRQESDLISQSVIILNRLQLCSKELYLNSGKHSSIRNGHFDLQSTMNACPVFGHPAESCRVLDTITSQVDYCYANANDNEVMPCGLKGPTRPYILSVNMRSANNAVCSFINFRTLLA